MKKLLFVLCSLFTIAGFSQTPFSPSPYIDSVITVNLTQRSAYWITNHAINTFDVKQRNAPDVFRGFVGKGEKKDSVFTVTLKAFYIIGLIEQLITAPVGLAIDDYNSILFNGPVPLANQIVSKANGNGTQKQVAQFILTYYTRRMGEIETDYSNQLKKIIKWTSQ